MRNEHIQYSVNNSDFYYKSEFMAKNEISRYDFYKMNSLGMFYKKIDGVAISKCHICHTEKCVIKFVDTKELTTVEKVKIKGQGDYIVKYKDINGKNEKLTMTMYEFNKMFGFVIVFAKYANMEMEKRMAVKKYGKVEFI